MDLSLPANRSKLIRGVSLGNERWMADDVSPEVIGGFLVTFGLALLAFIANLSGYLAIVAIFWLFVASGVLIWLWSG